MTNPGLILRGGYFYDKYIHYTVYTMYTIKCIVRTIQPTVYIRRCILYSVHCILYTIYCIVYTLSQNRQTIHYGVVSTAIGRVVSGQHLSSTVQCYLHKASTLSSSMLLTGVYNVYCIMYNVHYIYT